ncbi:hypothetical protein MSG28_014265 [Choristoneura fumiferana]|uniref:Uncharacterized protein n=1 Tax=Choristoneura fumiferana TaxID=7141 RepID=A0ACC0JGM7_CHOFU|nr:hypothetical protein MSG28_014265 [Choristoneura fumiferana]
MRAARRGQEGADCARAHPGCAAAAPAHTMIAAYHDINKLSVEYKLASLLWRLLRRNKYDEINTGVDTRSNMATWWTLVMLGLLALQTRADGGFRLPDQPPKEEAREEGSPKLKAGVSWTGSASAKTRTLTSSKPPSSAALAREPPQLSSQPRSEDSDWDALVKFGMRKIERFLRSTALEMALDDEVTSGGVIAPRFLDEIADEVDVIEDKKAPPFRRHKLKKLIIPMLLILKLFKLKLLLFLPLILGVIGYFKFCKPNSSPFSSSHYNTPQYSPAGIGLGGPYRESHYEQYEYPTGHKYGSGGYGNGGVSFRDHESNAQNLAYNGWEYRNKKGTEDIKAGDA